MAFQKFNIADNAYGILANDIDTTDTIIIVSTQQNLPTGNAILTLVKKDSEGNIVKSEKVYLTSRSGDTLTVQRGYDGDALQSFDAGDYIYLFVVSKVIQDIQDTITNDVVHNTGDETISGIKTFNNNTIFNGNVGIGINNPAYKLDIVGGDVMITRENVNTAIGIASSGGSGRSYYIVSKTDGNLGFYDATLGSDVMDFSNGNVGIGIMTPSEKLEINGNIKLSGGLINDHSSIVYQDFKIGGVLKGNIAVNSATPGEPFEINSATSNNVVIATGGGNVGIGTLTPTEKLEVNGNIKANNLYAENIPTTGEGYKTIQIPDRFNGYYYTDGVEDRHFEIGFKAFTGDVTYCGFGVINGELFLTASNKIILDKIVGIGTTTPGNKLTVAGGNIETTDAGAGVILKSPNGTRYKLTVDDSGNLVTTAV